MSESATYSLDLPIVLTFDWPVQDTSLNSRLHWAKRAEFARYDFAQGISTAWDCGELNPRSHYQTVYTFFPPSKRQYDLDNLLGRMKKIQDGFCSKLGINDSSIRRVTLEWGDIVKGGKVVVTITRL